MAQLSSTSAGAIGGALTLVFNYVVGAFWQIFASHLPIITPPSAELIGSEQLLVTALFTNWASKEGIGLNGNMPSKDEIMSSLKADANTAAAIVTAATKPAAATLLLLFLASCSNTAATVQQADTAISAPQTQADIALACGALSVADTGFQIAVKAGYADAGALTVESKVMETVRDLCALPYPQNTADVIKAVFTAAAQVSGLAAVAHAATAASTPSN